MKMNRVQFQAGLSMPEFYERFGTEAKCRAAVAAARWPHGFVCPACGGAARTSFERGGLRYWQCGVCARLTFAWVVCKAAADEMAVDCAVNPDSIRCPDKIACLG